MNSMQRFGFGLLAGVVLGAGGGAVAAPAQVPQYELLELHLDADPKEGKPSVPMPRLILLRH